MSTTWWDAFPSLKDLSYCSQGRKTSCSQSQVKTQRLSVAGRKIRVRKTVIIEHSPHLKYKETLEKFEAYQCLDIIILTSVFFFFFVLHKMSFIQFKIEYIPKKTKTNQTNKQTKTPQVKPSHYQETK